MLLIFHLLIEVDLRLDVVIFHSHEPEGTLSGTDL